jgi:hypothetical protein
MFWYASTLNLTLAVPLVEEIPALELFDPEAISAYFARNGLSFFQNVHGRV